MTEKKEKKEERTKIEKEKCMHFNRRCVVFRCSPFPMHEKDDITNHSSAVENISIKPEVQMIVTNFNQLNNYQSSRNRCDN